MNSVATAVRKVNVGQKFGRLTAVGIGGKDKRGKSKWLCRCECGNEILVIADNLRRGNTQSCGCRKLEIHTARLTKHGHARKTEQTSEYRSWAHAVGRCHNETDKQYDDYGGRGIVICRRWRESFEAFIEDMGNKPSRLHSIDRKDNDGNYSCGKCPECIANGWPDNCRWATPKEQANNRRKRKRVNA